MISLLGFAILVLVLLVFVLGWAYSCEKRSASDHREMCDYNRENISRLRAEISVLQEEGSRREVELRRGLQNISAHGNKRAKIVLEVVYGEKDS